MARLRKQDADSGAVETPLSDAQRTAIAEVKQVYAARSAQAEIMLTASRAGARDIETLTRLKDEFRRDTDRMGRELEEKIAAIRRGDPGRSGAAGRSADSAPRRRRARSGDRAAAAPPPRPAPAGPPRRCRPGRRPPARSRGCCWPATAGLRVRPAGTPRRRAPVVAIDGELGVAGRSRSWADRPARGRTTRRGRRRADEASGVGGHGAESLGGHVVQRRVVAGPGEHAFRQVDAGHV